MCFRENVLLRAMENPDRMPEPFSLDSWTRGIMEIQI
jgi:hypothetical protein